MSQLAAHAAFLERELAWAEIVIDTGIKLYFEQECRYGDIYDVTPPTPDGDQADCAYARLLHQHQLGFDARLVLVLALAPHLRPQVLDPFLMRNTLYERRFTEFGGAIDGQHGSFLPTLESAAFLLAGRRLERRLTLLALFEPSHPFRRARLLDIDVGRSGSALFSAPLAVHREHLSHLTSGAPYRPEFSDSFPARRLHCTQQWEQLVLAPACMADVEEIRAWIEHGSQVLHRCRQIKPGFRSLFYGPPGTGKSLTAALLGEACQREVYRIDLSVVVSKYIGETEKNLASVFEQAEHKRWILFFDEADALFGARTHTASANDRYANQEVAYLLQRVEDYDGVVILASNLKSNIDEAFARRFQSMIYFAMPGAGERLRLWRQAFPDPAGLATEVDLRALADEYELSGGAIANVLRYTLLMMLRRGLDRVQLSDLRNGIRRELRKAGGL